MSNEKDGIGGELEEEDAMAGVDVPVQEVVPEFDFVFEDKIIHYQKQYMHLQEVESFGVEIRERMVAYPCGLFFEKRQLLDKLPFFKKPPVAIPEAAPPGDDTYIKLSCNVSLPHGTSNMIKVGIVVCLNKAALKHDILAVNDMAVSLVQYQDFYKVEGNMKCPYYCKPGKLSGKHFMFMHMQCSKSPCDDHQRPCSSFAFAMSDVLNLFILKLHVMVKNIEDMQPLSGRNILFVEDKLGEQLSHANELPASASWQYYDLAIPPDSTLVLASCTGHDEVVHDIFGC